MKKIIFFSIGLLFVITATNSLARNPEPRRVAELPGLEIEGGANGMFANPGVAAMGREAGNAAAASSPVVSRLAGGAAGTATTIIVTRVAGPLVGGTAGTTVGGLVTDAVRDGLQSLGSSSSTGGGGGSTKPRVHEIEQ